MLVSKQYWHAPQKSCACEHDSSSKPFSYCLLPKAGVVGGMLRNEPERLRFAYAT